ncbi:MAG: threonine--tRNA ligase, partial [Patescibacteria group bacterium]
DEGEAAFYGPKIDIKIEDAIGRQWQLTTVQLDFNQPNNFNLEYTDTDGSKQKAAVLHIAIVGSIERFMAILIEHFEGNFPTWLTPVQVKVLPITDKHVEYAKTVVEKLMAENIRAELDDRNERLQAKIRDAQLEKVAYMFIVGDKEAESNKVAVRKRDGTDLGAIDLESFINDLKKEIEKKRIN